MVRIFSIAVVTSVASLLASGGLWACEEGMVRDAAFDQPRDVYRLCVIAESDDTIAIETLKRLESWLATTGANLNLEVVFVAADAPDVPWTDFGIPSAPPKLPVTVLVGRRIGGRKAFVVSHWEPGPSDAELESLRTSPAREAIRRHTTTDLAVVVYVPGTIGDNQRIEAEIDRACGAHSESVGSAADISVVQVDRDDEKERLLLTFANTLPDGPAWVGIVFGKGKFMKPLEGDAITEAGLVDRFDAIVADCTCSQSPSRLGVDILMEWNADLDASVVRFTSRDAVADTVAKEPSSVEFRTGADDPGTTMLSRISAIFLWSLGGLSVVSAAAAIAILWWRQSQRR